MVMVNTSYATPHDKVLPSTVHGRRRRVGFLFYFVASRYVLFQGKRKFKYFNYGHHIYDHRHYHPTFIYTKVIHLTILF